MLKKPFILFIYGPTGVGKSDLASFLANQLPAEIINSDIGSFYTPLTIGTAKPDLKEAIVAHHLFDIINEPRNITVIEYRELFIKTINQIWHSGKLPIVVGGSGFYLKSLFFPPRAYPVINTEERNYPAGEDLWQLLDSIDPKRASQLHHNDHYRIKRALDIWYACGVKPSLYTPIYEPIGQFAFICLTRDRAQLYDIIDSRTKQMIDRGWVDEVAQLQHTAWEPFLKEKKIIGYDILLNYLDRQESQNIDEAIKTIQTATRNYAKRQITFWHMLKRELMSADECHTFAQRIEMIDVGDQSFEKYKKSLVMYLKSFFK